MAHMGLTEAEWQVMECLWTSAPRTGREIIDALGEDERLMATIQRGDNAKSRDEGLIEIYKRQKPGEPPTRESAQNLFNSLFFDPKRYDLMRVGRYKFNKKLSLATRIQDHVAAEDIVNPETGEVMVKGGDVISKEMARDIQNAGINSAYIDIDGQAHKVVGNHFVDASKYLSFDPKEVGIQEYVLYPLFKEILDGNPKEEDLRDALKAHVHDLCPKHILPEDIVASVSYLLGLPYGDGACMLGQPTRSIIQPVRLELLCDGLELFVQRLVLLIVNILSRFH